MNREVGGGHQLIRKDTAAMFFLEDNSRLLLGRAIPAGRRGEAVLRIAKLVFLLEHLGASMIVRLGISIQVRPAVRRDTTDVAVITLHWLRLLLFQRPEVGAEDEESIWRACNVTRTLLFGLRSTAGRGGVGKRRG